MKDYKEIVYNYISDVENNKIIVCDFVKLAIKRHLSDLKREDLFFDEEAAIKFLKFSSVCKYTKGEYAKKGKKIEFTPQQIFRYWVLFGWKTLKGTRRFRRVYFEVARKNGKMLDLTTPIPTPNGFTTVGELSEGDIIYSGNGKECEITQLHPIDYSPESYLVTFSNGEKIKACADHKWSVYSKTDRRHKRGVSVLSTKDMINNLYCGVKRKEPNYSIKRAGVIKSKNIELPIDPYLLGLWLGDGSSYESIITGCKKDLLSYKDYINKETKHNADIHTYINNSSAIHITKGLRTLLRENNLLKNKHIPEIYFDASENQRLELLRGLMDSDGYIGGKYQQCEFVNKNTNLTYGVWRLASSFGWKARIIKKMSKLYGKECGIVELVLFNPNKEFNPFKLDRKSRKLTISNRRDEYYKITSIEKTTPTPMRCISVDSEDRTFLCGHGYIPTHNSEEAAVVCAYMLLADGEFGAEIYTAATKHDQAKIVFDAAKVMIQKLSQDSAKVRELVKIHGLNVSVLSKNSRLEPLSSRSEKQDGLNPSCGIIDEYHAHPNSDLMEVIETGMGSREQPLIFVITTAGFDKQSPCHSVERRLAVDILKGIQKDDSMLAVIYTLDEGDDWKDENVWVKANPNIGITPSWEFMRQQCNLAVLKGKTKEVEFKTKNLNIWTNSSMAWINDEVWMLGNKPLPDLTGRECYGGLDMASVRDFNAYVLWFPPTKEEQNFYVLPFFWLPENTIDSNKDVTSYWDWKAQGHIKLAGEMSTDKDIIKRDILEINSKYKVKGFAYDRWLAEQSGLIKDLLDEGYKGYEFGQGYKSMSPAIKDVESLILDNKVIHGGNPILRWMCSNVELTVDAADNVKMDKSKSKDKIDGMVALVMSMACYYGLGGDTESVYEKRGVREL